MSSFFRNSVAIVAGNDSDVWFGGTWCAANHKKHRAETKRSQETDPEKADPTERSWRGVLRGHVPSKSLSADSEIPCAMLLAHVESGADTARCATTKFVPQEQMYKRFHEKTSPPPIGGPPPLSGEANFSPFLLYEIGGHGTPCPYIPHDAFCYSPLRTKQKPPRHHHTAGASSSALFDSFLIWKRGMHPCPDILRLRPALLRFSAAGYTWQHARFCSVRRS